VVEASTQAQTHSANRRAQPEIEEHPFGKPPVNLPPVDPPAPTRISDTAGISIEVIDLAKSSDRKRFIDAPDAYYQGDPNYISPLKFDRMHFLDPAKNPGLKSFEMRPMLAKRDGKVVGRITAHIDRAYNEYHGTKTGWFGFFECVNDRKVAHAMLAEATKWLKEKGAVECIGPFNFSTNHQVGLLVENFDRPAVVEMTYNPRYYEELITSFGFGKAKDLFAWWIDVSKGRDDPHIGRIAKIADKIRQREGVTVRAANLKNFREEVEKLFTLYNEAWQKNWGFVPVSRDEFEEIAKQLKQIAIDDLIVFVEVEGKPVAFVCTLPDVNELMPRNGKMLSLAGAKMIWQMTTGMKAVKHARLMVLGVVPGYRKRGLESMLFVETALRCKANGFMGGEIGWTLEDNHLVNRACESMGAKLYRKYRLFGVTL
jgi:hypothetical protein